MKMFKQLILVLAIFAAAPLAACCASKSAVLVLNENDQTNIETLTVQNYKAQMDVMLDRYEKAAKKILAAPSLQEYQKAINLFVNPVFDVDTQKIDTFLAAHSKNDAIAKYMSGVQQRRNVIAEKFNQYRCVLELREAQDIVQIYQRKLSSKELEGGQALDKEFNADVALFNGPHGWITRAKANRLDVHKKALEGILAQLQTTFIAIKEKSQVREAQEKGAQIVQKYQDKFAALEKDQFNIADEAIEALNEEYAADKTFLTQAELDGPLTKVLAIRERTRDAVNQRKALEELQRIEGEFQWVRDAWAKKSEDNPFLMELATYVREQHADLDAFEKLHAGSKDLKARIASVRAKAPHADIFTGDAHALILENMQKVWQMSKEKLDSRYTINDPAGFTTILEGDLKVLSALMTIEGTKERATTLHALVATVGVQGKATIEAQARKAAALSLGGSPKNQAQAPKAEEGKRKGSKATNTLNVPGQEARPKSGGRGRPRSGSRGGTTPTRSPNPKPRNLAPLNLSPSKSPQSQTRSIIPTGRKPAGRGKTAANANG